MDDDIARTMAQPVVLFAVLLIVCASWADVRSAPTTQQDEGAGPAFELPAPTGPLPVGTTRWVVGAGTPRALAVVAWYPSAARGNDAPYLREGLVEARTFSRVFFRGRETGFDDLAGVRTHAALDAEPSQRPARFPLLVFSHGYTGLPSASTALLEDLASHGYAVLSVVHPGGSVIGMLDDSGGIRPEIRGVLNEWAREDATMAEVTGAPSLVRQRELLQAYLDAVPNTTRVLAQWVANINAALASVPPALRARITLNRYGALGHSMGGVAAAELCRQAPACAAAANLDGIPQHGPLIDTGMAKPLLMVYSSRPGRLGANDAIYRRAGRPYYRADVADTRHLDFTDMAFWGPLRDRNAVGPLDAARATAVTRQLVREFFDQALRNRPSPVLAGRAPLDGVTARPVR